MKLFMLAARSLFRNLLTKMIIAADGYESPMGKDNNSGSIDSPVLSLGTDSGATMIPTYEIWSQEVTVAIIPPKEREWL